MRRNILRLLPGVLAAGAVTAMVPGAFALADAAKSADGDKTDKVVVRPVTSAGRPAAGYRAVADATPSGISCGDQVAWSVSKGVDECGASADYLPSCWRSTGGTALCLRDADVKQLVRVPVGAFPVAAAKPSGRRSPQAMVLSGGGRCEVRIGGAWASPSSHPDWVGFYSCTNGDVFGPETGDGIDRSEPVWTVHLQTKSGRLVTRKVLRATYVGTAA